MTIPSHTSQAMDGPVLILAPLGRDAEGTASILNRKGIPSLAFRSMEALCQAIGEDSGVLIITEEAFTKESLPQLLTVLEKQPLWSDLPIISIARLAEDLGNVTFLERPLHTLTLVSAVRAGLKARRRQFQNRDDAVALKEYAARLEESNRELEQFAYVASHDLQAPLRKVKFFSDMLEQLLAREANAEVFDIVGRMKNSVERMQQMVSDLLQLSRVHRQSKPFEPINLANILQAVTDDLFAYQHELGGTLEINNHENLFLLGDPGQLQQVLQNLIQNALKFHRKGVPPVVRVMVQTVGDHGRITVEDNGIGFKQEYAERIFETFQRLHSQSEYTGTGIGLSIVKKIVERHQGSIQVESVPDEGSRFVIELPLAKVGAQLEASIEAG
jgi:signal transduction histidine kinase